MAAPTGIKLTPITRLSLSLDQEMDLDREGVLFDESRYKNYVSMLQESESKMHSLARSIVITDAIVFFLEFGRKFTLPVIDIPIGSLPAALEIATFFSCLTFVYVALAFINSQAYAAIVNQFSIRRANLHAIDPDFLIASDRFIELFLKLHRTKFNLWGPDFFTPRAAFKYYSIFVVGLALACFFALIFLHMAAIAISIWTTWNAWGLTFFTVPYFVFVICTNVGAILVVAKLNSDFLFDVAPPSEEQTRSG
jgi:hypothetical protein